MKCKINHTLGSFLVLAAFVLSLMSTDVARAGTTDEVQGFTGQIAIVPNANLEQVVIHLTSPILLSATSNQIVFVLQGHFTNYPSAWSGSGRVLVSHGWVVVSPAENQSSNAIFAFKFSEQTLPASLKDRNMETYPVFGIARYGETTPLTSAQITELAETGKFTKVVSKTVPTPLDNTAPQFRLSDPKAKPLLHVLCAAGGVGATSCSSGSCSVTCESGYYACCDGDSCGCLRIGR